MINMVSFSKILRISGLELKKHRSKTEKKIILVMFILGALVYSSIAIFIDLGISGTEKYYTFYSNNEIIIDVLRDTGKFILGRDADSDLFIDVTNDGIFVYSKGTERAKAAITEFERAIKEYNNLIFSQYEEHLAYPLRVLVSEIQRDDNTFERMILETIEPQNVRQESTPNIETNIQNLVDDTHIEEIQETYIPREDVNNIEETVTTQDNRENIATENNLEMGSDSFIGDGFVYAQDINPFAQFSILLIIVIMTMPLSMISLIYSNSIMSEKINKRGIFLLLAPLSNFEIILGKTFPYLLMSLFAFIPVIILNTSGIINITYSVLVIFTVVLAYLAIGFFCAMISRSHKELSFIGIFAISLYSCYLLIPTFMLNFSVISLASPLSIVAKIFRNEFIPLQLLLFTILPTLISALCIFYFSSKMFNEQDLFSYKTIAQKIKTSIHQIVKKNKFNLFLLSFLSIPIIFLIQLMMIVVVLSLNSVISVFIMILLAAIIEEIFRNSGIYTILSEKKGNEKNKNIIIYSILAGVGFFVGEKMLLLIMIAPFIEAYSALVLSGLLLPLTLHTLLTVIFSYIVKYTKAKSFWVPTLILGVLHFIINISIAFIGGGLS